MVGLRSIILFISCCSAFMLNSGDSTEGAVHKNVLARNFARVAQRRYYLIRRFKHSTSTLFSLCKEYKNSSHYSFSFNKQSK